MAFSRTSSIISADHLCRHRLGTDHQIFLSWNASASGLRKKEDHDAVAFKRRRCYFQVSEHDVRPIHTLRTLFSKRGPGVLSSRRIAVSAFSEGDGDNRCINVDREWADRANPRLSGVNARKFLQEARCISPSNSSMRGEEAGLNDTGKSKHVNEESWLNFWSHDKYRTVLASMVAAAAAALVLGIPSAEAADALKTCACLLKNCRLELARCIGDPKCAANIACLQTCNDRPDETECQIKCGDLFANSVVDDFNRCAVSDGGCVPQKSDEGLFPIPPPEAVVPKFDARVFDGNWYISSGLNPTFDTFDCQLHEFMASEPDKMMVKINWRVNTPDGGFFTRQALQRFVRDPKQEGLLLNHDNEFLHYKDDWYILAAQTDGKPDDFIYVYYKGSNDAWDGYGGAVIYTRSPTLPPSIRPQLEAASKSVGLKFSDFRETDNSCPPLKPLVARLEKKAEDAILAGEQAIVQTEKNLVEKAVMIAKKEVELLKGLGKGIGQEVVRDEEIFLRELAQEEKDILKQLQGMGMDAADIEETFRDAIPIRRVRTFGR